MASLTEVLMDQQELFQNKALKEVLARVSLGPLLVAIGQAERDREHRGKSAFLPEHCDNIVAACKKVEAEIAELYKDQIVSRCKE
jgi:hypothetical protein